MSNNQKYCEICQKLVNADEHEDDSSPYICEPCIELHPEMSFCNICKRYEETDGMGWCGTCQYNQQFVCESCNKKCDEIDDLDDGLCRKCRE